MQSGDCETSSELFHKQFIISLFNLGTFLKRGAESCRCSPGVLGSGQMARVLSYG